MQFASLGALTLVFTDIEDSSVFSERYRAAFEPTRNAHFALLRAGLEKWNGREVKSAGDSLFLVFDRAADAVQWAAFAQQALLGFDWPAPVGPIRVRMGIHTGEPYYASDNDRPDYFGPAVNRAARVMGAAHGGQILLSDTTRALALSELPPPLTLRDMGLNRLKGVGEERLWQILHPDLPSDFPPLQTLNPERHNLPVAPTPYLGREREIAAWYGLLTGKALDPAAPPPTAPTTRLLTLTAFGGMGKTRSALHLAELCVDQFAQGVCWVEAEEAGDTDGLMLRIAQALRLDVSVAGRALGEQVRNHLRERELLLVLDNTENIPDAARLVREILQATRGVCLLVTTRRALDLRGETIVELRPLPASDSQRLFVDRARACRDDFTLSVENAADVAALCARLEGVPLALELAAARASGMTPRQMLLRLDERFRLLQSRSPDLPPRQRALKAAIDWSYNLLGDDEKEIFAQLGVFAGGFTMEDAEAVCEGFDVFESVLELRRGSFFRVETDLADQQDRFVMLESLREYAVERLADLTDADGFRARHADHFLKHARKQTARFRSAGEAAALRELVRIEENLRAAQVWAESMPGKAAQAADLGLQRGLALARRGYRAQARVLMEAAITTVKPIRETHPALYLELLIEVAGLAVEAGVVDDAQDWIREARARAEAASSASALSDVENLLGWVAMDARDWASARLHFQNAHARAAGDAVRAGNALNNLGLTERRDPDGDPNAAARSLTDVLALRRKQGDRRGQAETLTNLGVLAFYRRDWDAAWAFYAEALDLERELNHLYGIARQLVNLGETALERDSDGEAWRLFAASERLMHEIGSSLEDYVASYLSEAASRVGCAVETLRSEARAIALSDLSSWALTPSAPAQRTEELPNDTD